VNTETAPHPPLRLSWLVWGLGALFYLIGFFHRVAPAVLTRDLMQDFDLGAAALGNLSALYFYSYWSMQIPTGILADIWGPRRLLTLGALGAACGSLLFALSPAIAWAGAGRFLVGGCVAVAFVANLKLAAHWFPQAYFSMISGIGLMAGILGAVAAGAPLRLLTDLFGWRPVMVATAAATGLLALVIRAVVRDDPRARGYAGHAPRGAGTGSAPARPLAGVREVFRHANSWLLFFIPSGLVGSVLAFSGLWGVPYLSTHYGLSAARASFLTTSLLVAWALASPLLGRLSDRIGRRKPLLIAGCALSLAGWTVIFFIPGLSVPVLTAVMVATGACSASFIICFAHAKESVPARLAGTISGVINMGIMLGPTALQPAVGWMLDRRWEGEMLAGARVYGLGAYQFGFALILAWLVVSFALIFFTRETHCRQKP
jgi:MFS family permease